MHAKLLALVLAAAPQAQPPSRPPLRASVQLDGFPFVRQKPDFCGEADVEMALKRLGRPETQDDVFAASGVDPLLGRGAYTDELARSMRKLGLDPGDVWHHLTPDHAAEGLEARWGELHADLLAGHPSIVCMHYSDAPKTTEHFRLVTGYDATRDEIVYQEPAEDDGANRRMSRALFFKLWTFKPSPARWTLIRLRVVPKGEPPALAPEPHPTRAELSQHVQALKETLPRGMTLAWERPFLVVGDEPPDQVQRRARDVVKWTKDLLLKDFFTEIPRELTDVWILGGAASYEKVSRELFKIEPDTPYGYFLSSRRSLVMNIKPGYGTLTHELVHPFMHEAWADAPAWLNEGLASLFEFPFEKDGHLHGRVNWRLPGLQKGLKRSAVPSFHTLVHLSSDAFYDDPVGLHYAAARYLCYWLQERGVLDDFVKKAIAQQKRDPSGWTALEETLGADPDSFRAEWEKLVLGLVNRS